MGSFRNSQLLCRQHMSSTYPYIALPLGVDYIVDYGMFNN